jgi:hypothetical protein
MLRPSQLGPPLVLLGLLLAGCRTGFHQVDPEYRAYQESADGGKPAVQQVMDPMTLPGGEQLEIEEIEESRRFALVVSSGDTPARHIPLPVGPECLWSIARIAGPVRPGLVVMQVLHYRKENCQTLAICDLRRGIVTDTLLTPRHSSPHLGLEAGDLWIQLPALDDRPDPTGGRAMVPTSYELHPTPVDQVLHHVTPDGQLVPTRTRIPCRKAQLYVDRTRGRLYCTSWDGQTLEERSATGELLRSWPKPRQLKAIMNVSAGFGRHALIAKGYKVGSSFLLAASFLCVGLDVDAGTWQLLESRGGVAPFLYF